MSKRVTTPAEVEKEIARLLESDAVKLSQHEQRVRQDKRRKYLADLRWHEKRGRELAALGVTHDNIRAFVEAADAVEE